MQFDIQMLDEQEVFMTRIIVCGGRDFNDYELFRKNMDEIMAEYPEVELVSGHARGADMFAERYASEHNVPIAVFKADWEKYGRAAGPIRNRKMLEYALEEDAVVIAFWDGESRGTRNMVSQAEKAGALVTVVRY